MLKNFPSIISPDLMMALMQMADGDEIVFADGSFSADMYAQRLIRAAGVPMLPLLEAVLDFLPIDATTEDVAAVMQPADPHAPEPSIWTGFRHFLEEAEERRIELTVLSQEDFCARAKTAYAVVATGETGKYGSLILKKGVVTG